MTSLAISAQGHQARELSEVRPGEEGPERSGSLGGAGVEHGRGMSDWSEGVYLPPKVIGGGV